MIRRPPRSTRTDTLFPYTTLFRSGETTAHGLKHDKIALFDPAVTNRHVQRQRDRGGRGIGVTIDCHHHFLTGKPKLFGGAFQNPHIGLVRNDPVDISRRSEEHTSELQSLMRISYAVFCLKKKKKTT